ncbi:hypothetical protein, partial [Sphingomonas sp. LH128]|uniref:hypothetical protein n=1 Tax=Sphingomonas sp. LH128 TaxID=473781 RepID=UPI002E0D3062
MISLPVDGGCLWLRAYPEYHPRSRAEEEFGEAGVTKGCWPPSQQLVERDRQVADPLSRRIVDSV